VNELALYHEVHGTGRPLVLLHGAMSTIETSFGEVLPAFAETRQVIAIEQQAHGRTPDIERPLTYAQMADDTAALLRRPRSGTPTSTATAWARASRSSWPCGIRT
jgi:pimeloyl-ACP methyl ester carboxylesterase